jgi:hypothetical protein
MQIEHVKIALDGEVICSAERAMLSAYSVVADRLNFIGVNGEDFFNRVKCGEKFPVIAFLADGTEKVAGEAFMYEQTPDRLHIGIWRFYKLNAATGRWEI